MKRTVFLLSLICLFIVGCSNHETSLEAIEEAKEINMASYEQIVDNNKDLIADWIWAKKDAIEEGTRAANIEEDNYFKELKSNLLPSATKFASELNITKEEIESMTGSNISNMQEYEEALIGLMLFATATEQSIIDDETHTRGGSLKDCFMEATGIAAGIAIFGTLTKGTMTKAAIKATLKLVAKVGVKNINGVGLILLAGEIIWCMS